METAMAVELRHLRYIIAVAEEGTSPGPPSGSASRSRRSADAIKAIEQEIEVQLFRRVPRGVELTEAGRAFLDGARATFANLDRTLETARRTARGEEGRILGGVYEFDRVSSTGAARHPRVPRDLSAGEP